MILAAITFYTTISSILVPITGLLLPGFAMTFFFLKIEAKNQIVTPDSIIKPAQIWIHKFFPMIQKVKVTEEGMTLQNFVHELNATYKNANLKQLKQEIHDLKELHDGMDIAYKELKKVKRIAPDLILWHSPILKRRNLKEWINHLEAVLGELKSPNEVTVNQIQEFLQSKIPNCSGWVIDSKAFQINTLNKFSEEDKIEIKNNLENYGKVGFFCLICHKEDSYYIQEDQNVFEAVKEIISFIAPKESVKKNYTYNSKYQQDLWVQEIRANYEIQEYFLGEYSVETYTDYKLKDEQVRKETVREMGGNYGDESSF